MRQTSKLLQWLQLCLLPLLLALLLSGCGTSTTSGATNQLLADITDDLSDLTSQNTWPSQTSGNTASTQTAADTQPLPEESISLRFTVLDVGQGLSVLAESEGHCLLFDGGGQESSDYVVAYLQQQGIETLDYVIASHYDSDHLSGLIGVLNRFDIGRILAPDYEHDSKLYHSFMDTAAQLGKDILHPEVGDSYELGSASFTILAPAEITDDSNDNSIAIKLTDQSRSFIITGDAEHGSEAEMIASGIDLDCDVLVLGHHGSATSTSWDFLEAATPEYAILSCGLDNSYGHPDADTMEKLEVMEIELFRTDLQGEIIAATDGEILSWNTAPANDYRAGDEDPGTLPQAHPTAPAAPSQAEDVTAGDTRTGAQQETTQTPAAPDAEDARENTLLVWISSTGSKYHRIPNCGRMNPDKAQQMSRSDAEAAGYTPCEVCMP